jgi:4-amino-4-deoxy-L-arabinose transferase-like glycosyltransferase
LEIGHWGLVIGIPLIFLIPGYLTLCLPFWGNEQGTKVQCQLRAREDGQRLFFWLLTSVLISGLIGLVLAQLGIFSVSSLLLALTVYSCFCLAFIAASRRTRRQEDKETRRPSLGLVLSVGLRSVRLGWEDAIVIILFCLSLLLYARPAEYILGWLDAGWYVNTGVHIAKTGSLTGESQILASLPSSAKTLFYDSFALLKQMFPYFPDTECRGIYLWAFALADPDRGKLTAYHPPLFSIWIAIFYAIGGLRFCLYATPFFGALSVVSVYLVGKVLFSRKIGLLAAVLLAISFTQIFFSRTPFSEMLSQCLLFSGIYALTSYIMESKPLQAAIAAFSFGQAILCRIENLIVILPLILFFGCWMILNMSLPRDFRFFAIPFGLLLVEGTALALTVSRPYVELNSYGLWFKLRSLLSQSPALSVLSVVMLGGVLVLVILLGLSDSPEARNTKWLKRIYGERYLITTLLALAILLVAIYAYFVRSPLEAGMGEGGTLAQLGQFISPLGLWLGVFGLVELLRRDTNKRTAFFLAVILSHGLASMSVLAMATTSSYVYHIRRQVPMLIPSLILLASYAILFWNKGGKLLRFAQLIAIVILLVSTLALTMPYVSHREMSNAIAFSEKLASYFDAQDVVVFEEIRLQDSHVGHFAAPLWSIYGKETLLMSTANLEDEAFSIVIAQWLEDGKKVYFVSQSDLSQFSLHGYDLLPVAEERWLCSTITTRLVFPPEIREFEVPFYIYQIV